MTALTTTASLVELSSLDEETQIATTIDRAELEELLSAGSSTLWFELGVEGEAEPAKLTVDLGADGLRALLDRSTGDEIALVLDGQELAGLLEEPDVEAHGLRGALAVSLAVATTAIAAPSALAATQQSVGTASIGTAATSQQVSAATTSQKVGAAATRQVSRQVVRQQLVRGASAKSQRASAYTFSQLKIIRAGVVR
jgi:hypothetical protein